MKFSKRSFIPFAVIAAAACLLLVIGPAYCVNGLEQNAGNSLKVKGEPITLPAEQEGGAVETFEADEVLAPSPLAAVSLEPGSADEPKPLGAESGPEILMADTTAGAQNQKAAAAQGKPGLTRDQIIGSGKTIKTGRTAIPSPYDIFLALTKMGVDWNRVLVKSEAVIPDEYTDEVQICAVLGVKIADGIIAITAKNVDDLNAAADAIEALAKKLNVSDGALHRAEKVRKQAVEGQWLGVYLELGFLQTDILRVLEEEAGLDRRAIILAGGWLQGARLSSFAIEENYTEEASSYLRQPELIEDLRNDLLATSEKYRNHAMVQEIVAGLPALKEICDVPIHGTVPLEKVTAMREQTDGLVQKITNL